MFQIRLKELREREKLSQQALANILGVSQSTVGMWESGKNKPEHDTLVKIAEYFHISLDYLARQPADNAAAKRQLASTLQSSFGMAVYGDIQSALAEENELDFIPFFGLEPTEPYFGLKIEDDSMLHAGIPCGSTVVVHKQREAQSGQIAACLTHGKTPLLRRFSQQGDIVLLLPENCDYQPQVFHATDLQDETVQIIGVAILCLTIKSL